MESLRAKHMSLLSDYDAIFDGYFLLIFDLVYRPEDAPETKARAIVDKGQRTRLCSILAPGKRQRYCGYCLDSRSLTAVSAEEPMLSIALYVA